MSQFHLVALSLSTNETTDDFAFIFESIKQAMAKHVALEWTPKYLMADAAFQIQNGLKSIFPSLVDSDTSILMCWFHVTKAISKHAFINLKNRDGIQNDIQILHMNG